MPKQFDEETFISYEALMYNSLEIAEGEKPFEELTKTMIIPNPLPELNVIEKRVKELGYDTFEIHKSITTETRYHVE